MTPRCDTTDRCDTTNRCDTTDRCDGLNAGSQPVGAVQICSIFCSCWFLAFPPFYLPDLVKFWVAQLFLKGGKIWSFQVFADFNNSTRIDHIFWWNGPTSPPLVDADCAAAVWLGPSARARINLPYAMFSAGWLKRRLARCRDTPGAAPPPDH